MIAQNTINQKYKTKLTSIIPFHTIQENYLKILNKTKINIQHKTNSNTTTTNFNQNTKQTIEHDYAPQQTNNNYYTNITPAYTIGQTNQQKLEHDYAPQQTNNN